MEGRNKPNGQSWARMGQSRDRPIPWIGRPMEDVVRAKFPWGGCMSVPYVSLSLRTDLRPLYKRGSPPFCKLLFIIHCLRQKR
jgi:hypothetical protein